MNVTTSDLVLNCHTNRSRVEVYVGRPGPWGNPWGLSRERENDPEARRAVIQRYDTWIRAQPFLQRQARRELAGKRLGCWCAPQPCHGDALATLANDDGPPEDPVLVFGSNLAGRHGRGGARFAAQWRGAQEGIGCGRAGQSYAIPTRSFHNGRLQTLPPDTIQLHVNAFIEYAGQHSQDLFQVTRVGCGLAGLTDAVIAPLFKPALALHNVLLPGTWQALLTPDPAARPIRIIVAWSHSLEDISSNRAWVFSRLDRILSGIMARAGQGRARPPVFISSCVCGADRLVEAYALDRLHDQAVPFMRFPAEWGRYGESAACRIRDTLMAWYATHLITFRDGQSPGTRHMIQSAMAAQLAVRVVNTRHHRTDGSAPRS